MGLSGLGVASGTLHSTEVAPSYLNYYVRIVLRAMLTRSYLLLFLLDTTERYPAFVIKPGEDVVGFSFFKAHHSFPTFKSTAEITYFIDEKYSGKGLGKMALDKLIDAAREQGIITILASVSSKNPHSLSFHRKNGFNECGKFSQIGEKLGTI